MFARRAYLLSLLFACVAAGLLSGTARAAGEVDLRPLMTEVKNQGQRNTCSVFAATALMEFLLKQKTGRDYDLSESYAYYLGKQANGESAYVRGLYRNIDGLAGYLAVEAYAHGTYEESAWPYEPTSWFDAHDSRCVRHGGEWISECFTGTPPAAAPALPYRARPVFVEREKIAAFLAESRTPVLVNLNWYPALVGPRGDIRRLPTAEESRLCIENGTGCNGHVVLLVGYQPAERRFTFRNSWGSGWGREGYGTLPEDYVLQQCEACRYLDGLAGLSADEREFILKVTRGVSARLEN